MVELVYTRDLRSCAIRIVGSSPTGSTTHMLTYTAQHIGNVLRHLHTKEDASFVQMKMLSKWLNYHVKFAWCKSFELRLPCKEDKMVAEKPHPNARMCCIWSIQQARVQSKRQTVQYAGVAQRKRNCFVSRRLKVRILSPAPTWVAYISACTSLTLMLFVFKQETTNSDQVWHYVFNDKFNSC